MAELVSAIPPAFPQSHPLYPSCNPSILQFFLGDAIAIVVAA
jgi:hypothetical protein